ncbi:MAG: class A beta-lactamase-related serine hydrolase [Acidimicrobiales bacterium]|nr:MAG: class A beta-lactamase-related serine hydrolase [Acidimicrobiales bacterium]
MNEPSELEGWCAEHATSQLWVSVDGVRVIDECFGDTRPSDAADVGSIQKNVICLAISVLVGRGEIDIDQPMTTWLGRSWTQATAAQESAVTLRHVMSMTTGLYEDLTFEADPGRVWTYNNHAYHLVKKALAELTGRTTQELCDELIFGPLGMDDSRWHDRQGEVLPGGWPVSALHTSARDLIRFGEAMLDRGTTVGADPSFLARATRTSQDLNASWGLFWWDFSAPRAIVLGHRPGETIDPLRPLGGILIERRIAPDAPVDAYGGIGFGDNRLYVIPSHRAVVVRIGGPTFVAGERPRSIDIELWRRLDLSALTPQEGTS